MSGGELGGLVIDTSALAAVAFDEPTAEAILDILAGASACLMSAGTLIETHMVVEGRRPRAGRDLVERLMAESHVEVVAVDQRTAEEAVAAWRRYGKGNHPASLNYGDCFTYALAHRRGLPVLCVGEDFARTDIVTVLRRPAPPGGT